MREWQRLSWLCLIGGRILTRQDLEVFGLWKKLEELRKGLNVGEFLRRGLACSTSEFPIPPSMVGELAIPKGIAAPPCQALRFLAGGMRGQSNAERTGFEDLVAVEVACCLLHGVALDLQAFGYVPVLPATVIMFIDERLLRFYRRLRVPGRDVGSLKSIVRVLTDFAKTEEYRYVERCAMVEGLVVYAYPPSPRATAGSELALALRQVAGGSASTSSPSQNETRRAGSVERMAAPRETSMDIPRRRAQWTPLDDTSMERPRA